MIACGGSAQPFAIEDERARRVVRRGFGAAGTSRGSGHASRTSVIRSWGIGPYAASWAARKSSRSAMCSASLSPSATYAEKPRLPARRRALSTSGFGRVMLTFSYAGSLTGQSYQRYDCRLGLCAGGAASTNLEHERDDGPGETEPDEVARLVLQHRPKPGGPETSRPRWCLIREA